MGKENKKYYLIRGKFPKIMIEFRYPVDTGVKDYQGPHLSPGCGLFALGRAMTQPSKEQVREYMQRQVAEHRPPPDMREIRRQLGWDLEQMRRTEQPGRR
jgi:hypothetical protein